MTAGMPLLALSISTGVALVAGVCAVMAALRSRNATADPVIRVLFGAGVALVFSFGIAAGLLGATGLAAVGVLKGVLLATGLFALAGIGFGLWRARRHAEQAAAA